MPERGHRGCECECDHAADDAVPAHVLRDEADEGALDDGAHAAHAVHQTALFMVVVFEWCRG